MVAPILALIFSLLGLFFLALLFLPVALVALIIATVNAAKYKNSGYIGLTVAAWVMFIIAIMVSPTIWAIFGLSAM